MFAVMGYCGFITLSVYLSFQNVALILSKSQNNGCSELVFGTFELKN